MNKPKNRIEKNFRINTFLYISAAIIISLLAICIYLEQESSYLSGTSISITKDYKTYTTYKKIKQKAIIIPVTNYKDYKKVINYYDIKIKEKLTKKQLKTNNYIYIIFNEKNKKENYKFENVVLNGENIFINFNIKKYQYNKNNSQNVYEIKLPDKIKNDINIYMNLKEE